MRAHGWHPLYRSYLLRLWASDEQGQLVWRASLQNARTGEQLCFSTLERLFTFLLDQAVSSVEDTGEDGLPLSRAPGSAGQP
jgi:hypothetical protein